MTDMPPSRFRVVERGRRLEVIDTQAAKPTTDLVNPTPPPSPARLPTSPKGAQSRQWLSGKIRLESRWNWTTRPLYDAKGPRTLMLDDKGMAKLMFAVAGLIVAIVAAFLFPPLFAVPILLTNARTRETARNAVTAWIDSIESKP